MDNSRCYHCEKCCRKAETDTTACAYRKSTRFSLEEEHLYEQACNRLATLFACKHGWQFEGWVGCFNPAADSWQEGAGGIASFGDWCVSMDEIRADLMMDAPEEEYLSYLDAYLSEDEQALAEERPARHLNYRSWLMGARFNPEDSSPAWKERERKAIEEAMRRQREVEEDLKKLMKEEKDF